MSNPSRKKITNDDDEVEQLLQAAQDDMLLKLSLNSHIARASAIDSDLDRRFQALKKPVPHPPTETTVKTNDSSSIIGASASKKISKIDTDGSAPEADDLFARFAALKSHGKGKASSYGIDESCSISQRVNEEGSGTGNDDDEVEKLIKWAIGAARLDPSPPSDDEVSDNDDDEVEKLIKWAIGAARLDPSPPSDDEVSDNDDDSDRDDESDDDDDGVKKGKKKKKVKGNDH